MNSSNLKNISLEKKELYACDMAVRWGDMDAMGHVNNTCYFRFCEQARMEWFGGLDLSSAEMPDSQIVIINAWCEFIRPVVYPATLTVTMSGGAAGNSSFMSYYSIDDCSTSTDKVTHYASGKAKVVWVDRAGTSSVPIPGFVRQLLPESS